MSATFARGDKRKYVVSTEHFHDGTPCWDWHGHLDFQGYPKVWHGGTRGTRGNVTGAHRVLYEMDRGPIPDGLELDHLCRRRNCVNPAHMEAVTRQINMQRMCWAQAALKRDVEQQILQLHGAGLPLGKVMDEVRESKNDVIWVINNRRLDAPNSESGEPDEEELPY